jgi:Flp pilus assembly protein TadB
MTLLLFLAFIGFAAGGLIILNISPLELADSIIKPFQRKEDSIKSRILAVTKKKKVKGIKLIIAETKEILAVTNKSGKFSLLCILSFALFIVGTFLALAMSNVFLIPVLAVGMALLPFWYVLFTAAFYKKQLNAELETALSVITASYLRTESIITAVDENITYLNPPVIDVFKSFLNQTRLINSNIRLAIEALREKIDNDVFREWCEAVIACQEDKNLKSTLLPIVSKLSDIRIVASELEYLLYEPMKEFITMAILLIGNIPLLYFLNRSWFNTLMFHPVGKLILAITGVVVFVSLAGVIRLSKPLEYRR